MSNFTAYGTSPYVIISAEEMGLRYFAGETTVDLTVKPPVLGIGSSTSHAINKWSGYWNFWAFGKLTEPKYDGIADKIGQMSNQPDLVKDFHFISLMRLTNQLTKPNYKSNVNTYTQTPEPIKPPAPESGQGGT